MMGILVIVVLVSVLQCTLHLLVHLFAEACLLTARLIGSPNNSTESN